MPTAGARCPLADEALGFDDLLRVMIRVKASRFAADSSRASPVARDAASLFVHLPEIVLRLGVTLS